MERRENSHDVSLDDGNERHFYCCTKSGAVANIAVVIDHPEVDYSQRQLASMFG
jgi:hypothetical protein